MRENKYDDPDFFANYGNMPRSFLGHTVTKYHRTVETVFNALIDAQFRLQRISEPKPSKETLAAYPEMKDEKRRPIFLMVATTKEISPDLLPSVGNV